jgi:hypothetical protein
MDGAALTPPVAGIDDMEMLPVADDSPDLQRLDITVQPVSLQVPPTDHAELAIDGKFATEVQKPGKDVRIEVQKLPSVLESSVKQQSGTGKYSAAKSAVKKGGGKSFSKKKRGDGDSVRGGMDS